MIYRTNKYNIEILKYSNITHIIVMRRNDYESRNKLSRINDLAWAVGTLVIN